MHRPLKDTLGEARDIADGLHELLVLNACGGDYGDGAHALRAEAGWSADEDEVLHGGHGVYESYDDADLVLAGVDVGVEQLDEPLFGFEGDEHLAQAFAVELAGEQVGHAFHVDGGAEAVAGEGTLAAELFDGLEAAVVLLSFGFCAAGDLLTDAVERPTTEVFVEIAGGEFELVIGEFIGHGQDAVLYGAGSGDEDGEDAAGCEAGEVDMLQDLLGGGRGEGYTETAGNEGEDVGGALEVLLGRGDAGEAVIDLLAPFVAELGGSEAGSGAGGVLELGDVIAEGLGSGDAPGRGVGLVEEAGFVEGSHDVTDSGGAESVFVVEEASDCLGRHRFPGGDVELNDGREHQALAGTDAELDSLLHGLADLSASV